MIEAFCECPQCGFWDYHLFIEPMRINTNEHTMRLEVVPGQDLIGWHREGDLVSPKAVETALYDRVKIIYRYKRECKCGTIFTQPIKEEWV